MTSPDNRDVVEHITFGQVKRMMLGRLRYTPEELGKFRLGDIYDALIGYYEEETAKFRRIADVIRQQTLILWNTQVTEESRKTDPAELWRFSWEYEQEIRGPQDSVNEDKLKELEDRQKNFLMNM